MSKRLTIEEVKLKFEERGYILLEEEYRGYKQLLKYKCIKHPNELLSIAYNKFQQGSGCKFCATEKRAEGQRLSIDFIRNEFAKRGYELLDNVYINADTKLKFKCPTHPDKDTSVSYSNLKKDAACTYCSREKRAVTQRHSIDFISSQFLERGYKLLEPEYTGNKQRLKFECPTHPNKDTFVAYSDFVKGSGCVYCGYESLSDQKRLSIEYVREEFNKRGYTLLENEYVDNLSKLKYKCSVHIDKELSMSYGSLQKGSGCPYCAYDKNKGENNHFWKGGVSELSNYLRQYLTEWKINAFKKYDYTCFVSGVKGGQLEIHHTKPFNIIRDNILNELNLPLFKNIKDYTEVQLNSVLKSFLREHDKNEGIPISETLHSFFHLLYGWDEDVTLDDLFEFKKRYFNGEFEIQKNH